jgi:threonine aldolase
LTAKAKQLLQHVFEREVACFLVTTGTAANALALEHYPVKLDHILQP